MERANTTKTILLFFLFAFLTLSVCGCTTVGIYFTGARLESPETLGKKEKTRIGFSYSQGRYIKITDDASIRPVTLANPQSVSFGGDVGMGGGAALTDFLDILIKGELASPSTVGIKLKIFGDSASEAKPGNLVLSVTGAAGTTPWDTGQGDQDGVFGPGGYGWHWQENNTTIDGAAILGYRLTESLLFYGGAYVAKYWVSGNIHQDASVNGASPSADYSFSGSGQQNGYDVGVEFRFLHALYGILEGYYSTFQWSAVSNQPPATFGWGLQLGSTF